MFANKTENKLHGYWQFILPQGWLFMNIYRMSSDQVVLIVLLRVITGANRKTSVFIVHWKTDRKLGISGRSEKRIHTLGPWICKFVGSFSAIHCNSTMHRSQASINRHRMRILKELKVNLNMDDRVIKHLVNLPPICKYTALGSLS